MNALRSFSIGRMIAGAALVAVLVALFVPAAVNAAPPPFWAIADSPTYFVAGDMKSVTKVTLKKDNEVSVVEYAVRDPQGAPVWVAIKSASQPEVNGLYVPYAVISMKEPASVTLKKAYGAITAKASADLTPNDIKWLGQNIGNTELFPPVVYDPDKFWATQDVTVYRFAGAKMLPLRNGTKVAKIEAGTEVKIDSKSVTDTGYAAIIEPASYAGKLVYLDNLTDMEPAQIRANRLKNAFDKALKDLTTEELIYVFKTMAGLPLDNTILGCPNGNSPVNGVCGGGQTRP
jgi:hypothetical protein